MRKLKVTYRYFATGCWSCLSIHLMRLWLMLDPFVRTYVTASARGIDLEWLGNRHQAILDAIRDGDPERAAETMRTHAAEAADLIDQFEHPELESETV